ncbi:metalloendopeptidase, glycoprotease family protein [Candidatus Endolissoclinum faulkneri L2]|uniref:tRNA N6-adenosine threonylcarbamoyltransferase n=1 Tax=Candidatus Endolissoclinum faulkneri L2 TaxID=1193729 RepID=K7ZCX5_9PROT|nr:tRNA (adenosine(37)-N6)-threonylcarbamoyltransferase complex transferase subunit TsaD [Candidatus Endolissoclinum faulkneri]AFX98971.1 metalloendopeptidase, glycoprotease family protein [Candidatus Endolissoclinum faulkneri L2]
MTHAVLGIETSCDETSASVVANDRKILSNVVLSQLNEHRLYGGVVPEVAARAHINHLDAIVTRAMIESGIKFGDLAGVAATGGPGLIGGVLVGSTFGKAIATAHCKPFIAVNHLEGHALTARLTDAIDFPYLLLLVSGGHCQLLFVKGVGLYRRLGTTIDDAVGEAFDKTAKLLGLEYPGGPAVEYAAAFGDCSNVKLPRPMLGKPGCDFSFSGLKTAVRRHVNRLKDILNAQMVADIAAAFQQAVSESLVDRTKQAIDILEIEKINNQLLVMSGGVAANQTIRSAIADLAKVRGLQFVAPSMTLCGDNGAMIAWVGLERLRLGLIDGMSFRPRSRWPLDPYANLSSKTGKL